MADRTRLAYPDHPPTVCDHCEDSDEVYAQNRAPIHIHRCDDGVFRQWPARPVLPAASGR